MQNVSHPAFIFGALVVGFEFLHFAKQDSLTQTFCFAKYFGQPLKTVGVHCFPGALVRIPYIGFMESKKAITKRLLLFLARRKGFEPLTFGSVDQRSIQLS